MENRGRSREKAAPTPSHRKPTMKHAIANADLILSALLITLVVLYNI